MPFKWCQRETRDLKRQRRFEARRAGSGPNVAMKQWRPLLNFFEGFFK